ncbi:hybrid sensor histidine kinase/response regulator [Deferrisoma palaeochoriense]
MIRPTSLRSRFLVSFGALVAGLGLLSLGVTWISTAAFYRTNLDLRLRQTAARLESHLRATEESLVFRTRILAEVARVQSSSPDPRPLRQLQVYTMRWLTHDGLEVVGMGNRAYWRGRGGWEFLLEKAFSGVPAASVEALPGGGAALAAASPREGSNGVEEVIVVALPLETSVLQRWASLLGADVALLGPEGQLLGTSLPSPWDPPPPDSMRGEVVIGGVPHAYLRTPLRAGGRAQGWALILLPTGELQALAIRTALGQAGVLLAAFLGFFVLYRAVVRRATSDLERLSGWAQGFDPGHPTPPPPVARDDEVGILAASFGDLVARLESALQQVAAANEELAEANRTLEERVRAKTRELEEERERLDAVLSGMPHAVFLVDPNGRIVYANRDAHRRFGPVEGMRCARVLGRAEPPPEGGELELRLGGRDYLVQRAPAGKGHAVVVVQDITERRTLERQLQHAQRMESVGRLAAGVAHDFNNILGAMVPSLEMMERRIEDPKALRYLATVKTGADRAAGLVRQLLAFSRAGEFEPRPVDLNTEVERALGLVRPSLKGIELRWLPGDGLEPVRADPTQVQQVVLNLVLNAADAMGSGGALTVETYRSPDARAAVLAVQDTGPGVPEDLAERIFDPFFTTKEPGKGTGLGLAIVYGIAERHGGAVRLVSPPGGGARFEVTFPFAEGATPEAAAEGEPPAGAGDILVVDDDPVVLATLARVLRDAGYRVRAARSAEEALRAVERGDRSFRAALVDVRMPGMDGVALAVKLRDLDPGLPIRFISGYAENREDEIHKLGFPKPLRKPFQTRDLLTLLQTIVRS